MQNLTTPSQATNQLITLALQVAEGQLNSEALEHALSLRLQGMEAVTEDFHQRAQALGESFLISHGELIERVSEAYDSYHRALQELHGYFDDDDKQHLYSGVETLAEVTAPMLDLLKEYSEKHLSFGPSPYPLMNSVRNTLLGLLSQEVGPEALGALTEQAVQYHQQAISDISSSDYAEREGYRSKVKAFEDVIRALRDLDVPRTTEDLDEALRPLQLALEAITSADEKIFAENNSLAPTPMSAANVVINTARGVLNGQFELSIMEEALHWYKTYTEQIEEQFDAAVEGETNSIVILEELPRTREVIDLHDEVVEALVASLQDFRPETVEPLLDELEGVVERLHASSEVYLEAARREGKLVCVVCGHPNPPDNRVCESCGQKLPQLVDPNLYARSTFEIEERTGLGETEEDGVVTENVLKIFEACYGFFEQKISEEEFRKVLAWSRKQLEAADAGIQAMAESELTEMQKEKMTESEVEAFEENRTLFLDSKHLFEEGIDDWSEGLEKMEEYVETRHRPTLEAGIQKLWIGSQKVHQIQKVSEVAEKALAELEEKAREQGRPTPPTPAAEIELEPETNAIQDEFTG